MASLHNLVTVVDAASIFEQLSTMDTLVDRGWHELEGDKRTVAHLLVDQLESNLNPKPNPKPKPKPKCKPTLPLILYP